MDETDKGGDGRGLAAHQAGGEDDWWGHLVDTVDWNGVTQTGQVEVGRVG